MIAGVRLAQVLGPLVNSRIYPDVATENDDDTRPYITYTDVSNVPEITQDGVTGWEWVHMQINVWHDDKYEGALLANKVIYTINKEIKPAVFDGKTSTRDTETGLYGQIIEYEFWQTTPTE